MKKDLLGQTIRNIEKILSSYAYEVSESVFLKQVKEDQIKPYLENIFLLRYRDRIIKELSDLISKL